MACAGTPAVVWTVGLGDGENDIGCSVTAAIQAAERPVVWAAIDVAHTRIPAAEGILHCLPTNLESTLEWLHIQYQPGVRPDHEVAPSLQVRRSRAVDGRINGAGACY